MDFTFGLSAKEDNEEIINTIIDSIEDQRIPNYEVVIVGNCNICRDNTKVIPFNEDIKKGWITRKKNILTESAMYENIVYLHDYIKIDAGWYEGFLKFGVDFDVCMTRMLNKDGSRYRDWTLWAEDALRLGVDPYYFMLPYTVTDLTQYMYVSGAYWVGKKDFMLRHPLDERLCWGHGEDVEWAKRVRTFWNYSMNTNSSVSLLKQKDVTFELISDEYLSNIRRLQGVPGEDNSA